MATQTISQPLSSSQPQPSRAEALAQRLEAGAKALAEFAYTLTEAEWQKPVSPGGRKIGVVVHHVANVYPVEIQAAQVVASGQPLPIGWDAIHSMNKDHAEQFDGVTREKAIADLLQNAAEAAAALRRFTDAQLDAAAPVGLNANAPLTAQFVLEDHAVRHSYHHLAKIREALGK